MVKRLVLSPRQGHIGKPWPLGEREASAFVEVDGEQQDEVVLQEKAEEFMAWVCWLLSLAGLHDAYYWGAHHYVNESSVWKLRSSVWKPTIVKEWKPLGQGIFEGTVLYWRLPEFLVKGLNAFSDTNFSRDEFILALHLFLDSLPTDQLNEMRFIKKWTAFESLINDQAENDGFLYIFGQPDSDEFASLRKQLKQVIDTHPSVISKRSAKQWLTRQLSALERVPIKILARRYLSDLSIRYDEQDIDKIVDSRNDILHYIKTEAGLEEVSRLDLVLKRLLSEVLCRKLGWDLEKELHVNYSPPYIEPLPDYVGLCKDELEVGTAGMGRLKSKDGKHALECRGTLSWNRERIEGRFVSRDRQRLNTMNLMSDRAWVELMLTASDGGTVFADKAKIVHLDWGARAATRGGPVQNIEVNFNVIALRVFRQMA